MADTLKASWARDPLDSFTDREEIITQFQHLLQSAQTGTFHLLAVKGQSGTGKTMVPHDVKSKTCEFLREFSFRKIFVLWTNLS